MKSVRVFKPGDKVTYSVTTVGASGKKKHLHGRGELLCPCGETKENRAYLVRTPKGLEKVIFANELRKL